MEENVTDAGPLAGVRVLDLANERAGSVATMLMADLGGHVVRPESRDGVHRRPSATEHVGAVCWDRGKQRVVLDALDAADVELGRLLHAADVVVVDASPAESRAHGLVPASLVAAAPHAVVLWLPANGTHGPAADLPADPLLLAAISGFAQWQTSSIDVPIAPVVPFVSNVHGILGASAALAALLERTGSGVGQLVTVTGLHAAALMLATVTATSLDRPMAYSAPRDVRGAASFRLYRCSDGHFFFLGALVPTIFLAALDAVDLLELMVLPGIDGEFMNLYVGDNGLRVATALEATFARRPLAHWLDVLGAAGVPVAPVRSREEWIASDPFTHAAGLVEQVHAALGPVRLPPTPLRFSATPSSVGAPAGTPIAPSRCWPTDRSVARSTAGQGTDALPTGPPVARLRVLDLSTFLAGPTAPTLLGQWGADVIKVEPPSGDPYRLYNVSYAAVNQGKRRVELDLTTDAGMASLRALVAGADVLVDNLRPSLRAKLGLTTDALHAVNPRLVHTTVTAFGDQGAFAEQPGFDPVIQACSGLMHACGDDRQPYYTSTPVHDVTTGALAALGTLAALLARDRVGRGQRVSLSLAASSCMVQCEELTEYAGRPPAARGGDAFVGDRPTRRFYRAADGWVAIVDASGDPAALLAWCGAPGDADATGVVAATIATRPAADVVDALGHLGIAAARVVERDELATDPHLASHALRHTVHDAEIGRCLVVDQIATWSRSTPVDTTAAPSREPDAPRWRTSTAPPPLL